MNEVNLSSNSGEIKKNAIIARTKQLLTDNKNWEISWAWGSKVAPDELKNERESMFSKFAEDVLLICRVESPP